MPDKTLPKDEPGAEERFDRAVKNALAMKPNPHRPVNEDGKAKRKLPGE